MPSLLKIETICKSCNTQFIIVMQPEDADSLSTCPFCSDPLLIDEDNDEQEQ